LRFGLRIRLWGAPDNVRISPASGAKPDNGLFKFGAPHTTARRPMMAKRNLPEIQSIAATATKIIRIRNDTIRHSSTRICSASCRPMPPAPTMPMMVAERVLDSMKYSACPAGGKLVHLADASHLIRSSTAHRKAVAAA